MADDGLVQMRRALSDLSTKFSEANVGGDGYPQTAEGFETKAIMPLVDAWTRGLHWAPQSGLAVDNLRGILQSGSEALEALNLFHAATGSLKASAVAALSSHLDIFPALIDDPQSALKITDHALAVRLREHITAAQQQAHERSGVVIYVSERLEGAQQLLKQVENAAEEAQESSRLAKEAATQAATSALSKSFETTAEEEAKSANVWRAWSIATLVVVVMIGAGFIVWHPAPGGSSATDWSLIVYRVAILSALGALAAYLARQASQHRRIATWARGIQIQLQAFLGFVDSVKDERARQTMYELFGRRVLVPPPDGRTTPDDGVTNIIQPIVEQVARPKPDPN